MRGIDVSGYQGVIDWSAVKKDGVEFAILKVIRKDGYTDKQFEANWKGCNDVALPILGVYNYSYANTVDKARMDAKAVLSILNGRKTTVWMDVEDACMKNLGGKIVNIISAYRSIIEAGGCKFGVYTGRTFYDSYIKPFVGSVDYDFWIARYPVTSKMAIYQEPLAQYKPTINNNMQGWQYSSKGVVAGIKGDVDLDEWYATETKKFTNEEIADQVIAGAWGVNPARAVRLSAAGYNPAEIQAIVNQKLNGKPAPKKVSAKFYTVKRGDNLTIIARKYGTTANAIAKLNGIANVNRIYVGQKLRVA